MSGKPSRDKGSRGELEVCRLIRDALGVDVNRTPNSGGLWIPGDIQGLPDVHVEVKRQERWNLRDWMRQSEQDCPETKVPTVWFRSNREPWYVALWATDFLNLYKRLT